MKKTDQKAGASESIQFRLLEIRKINFIQNDYNQYGLSIDDILQGQIGIGVRFELKPDKEIFSIFLNLKYEKDGHRLYEIESVHKYHIINFRTALKFVDTGQFTLNDEIMKLWLQIAINDTRGMLVILNAGHDYARIIFPLIDLNSLIRSIKANQTEPSYQAIQTHK